MNTEPMIDTEQQVRTLFADADRYATTAIESLALDPEAPIHFDRLVELHALTLRGFPAEWIGTPRMMMELCRDVYIIHYLFPNLTDIERGLLLALRHACHTFEVYSVVTMAPESADSGVDKWYANERMGEIRERLSQCRAAVEGGDIERRLTVAQMNLLDSNYFDPASKRWVTFMVK